MKIEIEIPEAVIDKVVTGIMENFPEASSGCALKCIGWRYEAMEFTFEDEDGQRYSVNRQTLLNTFPLLFSEHWPKGCTQPPVSGDAEAWDNWLCQADACDFDAFAQLACFGEVIYG